MPGDLGRAAHYLPSQHNPLSPAGRCRSRPRENSGISGAAIRRSAGVFVVRMSSSATRSTSRSMAVVMPVNKRVLWLLGVGACGEGVVPVCRSQCGS